ncbi:Rha family transcriptional regulator [Muribaculum sp.]|uniref:Rha family transcriptional regulator n=1 Tax=Muribaculum sp. TaxID=1918611 RepID=UPI00258CB809|nr:Rha family transcriptional regulator [Muribaculum sp.]MCX4279221.1 Rha family transcriptional regulator [Muribaculum sp.]
MNLPIHQPTMTSLQIAEIANKQHRHVLEAIRKMEMAWVKVTGSKFRLSEYTDPTGRVLPCYNLTKEECLYIATKFNDEARARLVLRWMELERQQSPRPVESLESVFSESKRLADQMRQDLADGKVLPIPNVTLTAYDVAIYSYLRNGIKSAGDVPFCVTDAMVSQALGISIEDVKTGWERLEKGAYIVRRKFGDYHSFILGKQQP